MYKSYFKEARVNVQKFLNKKYKIEGRVDTLSDFLSDGFFTSKEERIVPKYKYNRTYYNRLSSREKQDEYEKKMDEKKTQYSLIRNIKGKSSFLEVEVPKEVYDFVDLPIGNKQVSLPSKEKPIDKNSLKGIKKYIDDKLEKIFDYAETNNPFTTRIEKDGVRIIGSYKSPRMLDTLEFPELIKDEDDLAGWFDVQFDDYLI